MTNMAAVNRGPVFGGHHRYDFITYPPRSFVIWSVLLTMMLSMTVVVDIAGVKFSIGRIVLDLLFIPATWFLYSQFSSRRRDLVACDFLMCGTAICMLAATTLSAGLTGLPSAGSEMIELFGSYLVARAFFWGRPALKTFTRVLKCIIIVVVAGAIMDRLSGQYVSFEFIGQFFETVTPHPIMRNDVIRATSIFSHPIFFGVFCGAATAIFLYSEETIGRRVLYCAVSFLGVLLSYSAAPVLAFLLAVATYAYDNLCKKLPWRWKPFYMTLLTAVLIVFFGSNSPMSFLIEHLTFNSENAYFRVMTWQGGFDQIANSPLVGAFRERTGNEYLDRSVNSVWLLSALHYGLPMVIFLILSIVSSMLSFQRGANMPLPDRYASRLRTGLSVVLNIMMFLALTVDFESTIWMFWGLCIGLRASFQEYGSNLRKSLPPFATSRPLTHQV